VIIDVLIIFDIEAVLVDGEFLPELAKSVGKEKEVTEITLKGIRGEIKWEEGLKERIGILKGVRYEDALEAARSIRLMKNAKEAVGKLKDLGFILIGVTGGFSILANRVKRQLKLDYVFSNEMIFDDGRLTGIKLNVNSNKAIALEELIKKLGIGKEETIAVVDGANDLKLFDLAKLKIAFNAQEIVKRRADVVVDEKDLMRLIPYVSEFCGNSISS